MLDYLSEFCGLILIAVLFYRIYKIEKLLEKKESFYTKCYNDQIAPLLRKVKFAPTLENIR